MKSAIELIANVQTTRWVGAGLARATGSLLMLLGYVI